MKTRPGVSASGTKSGRNLLTNLVLILPLLILYQAGVLYTLPVLNGADLLTLFLFRGLSFSLAQYWVFLAVLAAMFFGALALLRRSQPFDAAARMSWKTKCSSSRKLPMIVVSAAMIAATM